MTQEQIEKGMIRLALMGEATDCNNSYGKIKVKAIELDKLACKVLKTLNNEYESVKSEGVRSLLLCAMRRAHRFEIKGNKATTEYVKIRLTDYYFLIGLVEC